MFSKRKIKAFISFNWYWFLAIFFVVSVGFYYLFDVIKNPSYDERINVFIATNHIDSNKMEKDLYVGYGDTKIKEISIDFSNPEDNYFNMVFNTSGLVNTDILILPESLLEHSQYSQYFCSIDQDVIKEYTTQDIEYIAANNKNFGINVTDFINNYIEENEVDYYLFFNKKSNKLGLLSQENSINDYALKVLSTIFEGGK